MWSLFPKSWFTSSDPASRHLEAAVRHLRSDWATWLANTLNRVDQTLDVKPDGAAVLLESLDGAELLRVDQAFRYGSWDDPRDLGLGHNLALTPVDDGDPETAAYLFTAACNPSGMLRERALIAFGQSPGRLALAAALIRSDDWVPQVQNAAIRLLVQLLESGADHSLFEFMELLLRLRGRQRITARVWPDHIEPALTAARFREARWELTDVRDAAVRHFGYELVLRADLERVEEALAKGCADRHPRIALWGLREALKILRIEAALALLRGALQHPHAGVRAEAMRHLAANSMTDASPVALRGELQAVLRAALFDGSRGPREGGAFLLASHLGEAALPYWRRGIESEEVAVWRVALDALALAATPADAGCFERFVDDPSARVRAMALRGLVRAQAAGVEERLLRALGDPSASVVRIALRLLAAGNLPVDRMQLEAAHGAASTDAVRRPLIHAARLLGKWDALIFLLRLTAHRRSAAADAQLQRWIQQHNRRFSALSPHGREQIDTWLGAAKAAAPDVKWVRLEEILRHA